MLRYSKFYFIFSGTLVGLSLLSLALWQLNLGIDFTGGSLLEVEFSEQRPDNETIKNQVSELNLGEIILQPTEEEGLILRMKDIDEATHQQIVQKLGGAEKISEKRFDSIGPVIGKETQRKSLIAIVLVLVLIVLYIAWAFRKVSFPVGSVKYGLAALLALFHDDLITMGVFSVLGHFYNIEVGVPFVAALLTILGYSVNDTIVVFDRIRENLLLTKKEDFQSTVEKSIRQTFVRSVNTSLTVLFILAVIYFFGGETLRYFSLALIVGITFGTYSSIFIASPILVAWWRRKMLT